MRIKILLSFLIPTIILFLFFLGLDNENKYDTRNLVGKKINNFELKNLKDDGIVNSNKLLNNKYTLVNFWASWCVPCLKEHKYLMSLKKNSSLKILGVNFKDKKENAIKFLEDLGNPYYYLAQDKLGKQSIKFGIYGIPESILIDKNLQVIKKFVGPLNLSDYNKILEIIKH